MQENQFGPSCFGQNNYKPPKARKIGFKLEVTSLEKTGEKWMNNQKQT